MVLNPAPYQHNGHISENANERVCLGGVLLLSKLVTISANKYQPHTHTDTHRVLWGRVEIDEQKSEEVPTDDL